MALADMEFEEDLLFLELQLFDSLDGETRTHSSGSGLDSSSFEPDHMSTSGDSLEPEEGIDCDASQKQSRKRKRVRHRHLKDSEGNWLIPKIHLPRIPKSDIRRSYGLMFANVYNSCDKEFAAQFVDRMIPEDYVYVFSKLGRSQALSGPKEALTQFWFEKMNEAPDLLFSFDAHRIKVRTDATSVLTGSFSIRGTKTVYTASQERFVITNERDKGEVAPCEDLSQSSSVLSQVSPLSETQTAITISTFPSSSSQTTAATSAEEEVYPEPRSYSFCVSGTMSFHINSNFQIDKIEMNVENYLASMLSSISVSV